jgi:hypothetical protein
MDRRYYGLKAFVIVLGLAVVGITGLASPPRLVNSMAHLHYGAAMNVEMAIHRTSADIVHRIAELIGRLG